MIEKKPLVWFVVLAVVVSWPLFIWGTTALWALAMWAPGLAAILVTMVFEKKGFKQGLRDLGLARMGRFRFYVLAWLLPPLVVVLTLLVTVLLGLGQFDTGFTSARQMIASSGYGEVSPLSIVLLIGLQSFLIAPIINVLFTLGEEIGWRGFLLPRLLPLGRWPAILVSGAIWGLWHAPAIVKGLNYPGYPALGIPMMVVFCILLGAFMAWLYLETKSSWAPALAHGSINAWGAFPVIVLLPGFNLLLGGFVTSLVGWVVMAVLIGLLILTKRLPFKETGESPEVPRETITG